MVNRSKKNDQRYWHKWTKSGAVSSNLSKFLLVSTTEKISMNFLTYLFINTATVFTLN